MCGRSRLGLRIWPTVALIPGLFAVRGRDSSPPPIGRPKRGRAVRLRALLKNTKYEIEGSTVTVFTTCLAERGVIRWTGENAATACILVTIPRLAENDFGKPWKTELKWSDQESSLGLPECTANQPYKAAGDCIMTTRTICGGRTRATLLISQCSEQSAYSGQRDGLKDRFRHGNNREHTPRDTASAAGRAEEREVQDTSATPRLRHYQGEPVLACGGAPVSRLCFPGARDMLPRRPVRLPTNKSIRSPLKFPYVHAAQWNHCTPVQCLARRSEGSSAARVNVVFKRAKNIQVGGALKSGMDRRGQGQEPLVHRVLGPSWRRLAQSLPSAMTADNQCVVNIGIFVHKTVESGLQPLVATLLPLIPCDSSNTRQQNGVTHIPPMRTGFDSLWGGPWNFRARNRAERCRWSAGFLRDVPFSPRPLLLGAAPFSPHFNLIGYTILCHSHPSLTLRVGVSNDQIYCRQFTWCRKTFYFAGIVKCVPHSPVIFPGDGVFWAALNIGVLRADDGEAR
ncbi:hypothetical protein PR048_029445 [Dryococelus australis]|uniref:Uncharacterized protein n=1 Tax=Dryococelus australis TaxID=614101 RepID=A0ABQ9GDS0_9NEOP|nr:hypothetical protein PR048_029445 [Dryococelus australis]